MGESGRFAFLPLKTESSTRSYAAANAFNAKTTVEENTWFHTGIAAGPLPAGFFEKHLRLESTRMFRYFSLSLPAEAADARELIESNDVRLIYWARPATTTKNRTFMTSHTWRATFDNPIAEVSQSAGVFVDSATINVWVVNLGKHRVLLRGPLLELIAKSGR